jgi:zinc protease
VKAVFRTSNGIPVLTERSTVLPLVGIGVSARSGSLSDPDGLEGLSRLLARAMRMGTKALRSRALEERLDELGAQLSMSSSQQTMHFGGVVVAQNLTPFVELLASLLREPALRPADARKVQRELSAELVALCDDDRALCSRHFRRFAYGAHPYGRPRSGTRASLGRIRHADVVAHHARTIAAQNLVIDVWGDFEPRALSRLLERCFGGLPKGKCQTPLVTEPVLARGRRVLVVDKPERTQTQILVGALGTSAHDRDHAALVAGNTAFGGLFTSRLNDEVRVKRGLSYGASSSFTLSRTREMWTMHTFPAARDARACLELQLGLYERWVTRGVTARELAAVKRYLHKGHAFEIDTAQKRLDQRLDIELFDWPKTHHTGFLPRVQRLTRDDVQVSLARRLSLRDQAIVMVATADQLVPQLEKVAGVGKVEVAKFDDV